MTRRDLRIKLTKSAIWKETMMWMKHYRTRLPQEYADRIGPLLDLHRKKELEIENGEYITVFEYRDLIKSIDKNFGKGI